MPVDAAGFPADAVGPCRSAIACLFADGKNVDVEMVRLGWSRFDTRWGEGRFVRAFRAAEREAKRAERL